MNDAGYGSVELTNELVERLADAAERGYDVGESADASPATRALERARRFTRVVESCPCECNHGGFCGGCGHRGCTGGINVQRLT